MQIHFHPIFEAIEEITKRIELCDSDGSNVDKIVALPDSFRDENGGSHSAMRLVNLDKAHYVIIVEWLGMRATETTRYGIALMKQGDFIQVKSPSGHTAFHVPSGQPMTVIHHTQEDFERAAQAIYKFLVSDKSA